MVRDIVAQIKTAFSDEEFYEQVEDTIFPKFGWEYMQQALFMILADDTSSKLLCENAANVIWDAVLDGRKINKKTTVGLLYYRLGDVNNPYVNNTIWSITSKLYGLDYYNSGYNPLKDESILNKLAFYGVYIGLNKD